MSLISNNQPTRRGKHLFILENASHFTQGKNSLETFLLYKTKIPDLDKLTRSSYLDPRFFKNLFPNEEKEA